MNQIQQNLAEENGQLRGLTGSGRPGLYSVLGGTVTEEGADTLTLTGGAGQTSGTSKIARAHNDVRLAAVAAGAAVPGPGAGGGAGGGLPGRSGQGGNPNDGRLQ